MADVTRRHKLVRKANGLQDFQHAGLNASGTGVMGRPVVLIDNPAGNAMAIQLSRHEQAHRTCADNQYLGVSSHQVSSRSCQLCTPSLCLKSGRIQARPAARGRRRAAAAGEAETWPFCPLGQVWTPPPSGPEWVPWSVVPLPHVHDPGNTPGGLPLENPANCQFHRRKERAQTGQVWAS
jgi:hypothetical protein